MIKTWLQNLIGCPNAKWKKRSNEFQALAEVRKSDLIELVNNPNSNLSKRIKRAYTR